MRLHELVKGLAYLPERTAGFGDHLNSDERPNVGRRDGRGGAAASKSGRPSAMDSDTADTGASLDAG